MWCDINFQKCSGFLNRYVSIQKIPITKRKTDFWYKTVYRPALFWSQLISRWSLQLFNPHKNGSSSVKWTHNVFKLWVAVAESRWQQIPWALTDHLIFPADEVSLKYLKCKVESFSVCNPLYAGLSADSIHFPDSGPPSRVPAECRNQDQPVFQQRPWLQLPALENESRWADMREG